MAETSLIDIEFDGFKFKFDTDALDDMEFLELSDAVQNEQDLTKYPALVKLLMGDKSYKEAKAYFTKKDGRFTATKCGELFKHTIEAAGPKE